MSKIFPTIALYLGLEAALAFTPMESHQPEKNHQSHSDINKISQSIKLEDADIVMQTTTSISSRYIASMTNSKFSHTGLIEKRNGEYFVIEAVEPVRQTRLDKWLERGEGHDVSIYRIKDLSKDDAARIIAQARKFLGKHYDAQFNPSDERIYCSELIYKAVKRAIGISLGKEERLDLIVGSAARSDPVFHLLTRQRWGKKIPAYQVITPEAITHSPYLENIYSSYKN